jgi:hypothetical protein
MMNLRENNFLFLSGALTFLIFLSCFTSIILSLRPGITGPIIIAGTGILFCLVVMYLLKKYPAKKIAVAMGIGTAASFLVMVIVVLAGVSLIGSVNPPSPQGSQVSPPVYDRSITLDVPLPGSPATVPDYRVVSVQKFSYGTGTSLSVREHIPSLAEAPGLAEKILGDYGGLPGDAVIERTEQVFMKKYNLKSGVVEEQYPQYTRVAYRQYVNGSPVMGSGIEVSLGEDGELLDISKDWSILAYTGEIPVISAQEGFEKLKARDLLFPIQGSLDGYHITRVRSGYSVESHLPDASIQGPAPDPFTPVWIFYGIKPGTDSEPFPLLVNATRDE